MLGGNSPAASCAGLKGHPSVARIFHREKFARARPLKFEGGAARTRMSSGVGSDEHWCGRRDSNPHNFRHWNLNPARLPIPPRPQRESIRLGRDTTGGALITCAVVRQQTMSYRSKTPNVRRWTYRTENGPHQWPAGVHARSHFSTRPARGDGRIGGRGRPAHE